MELLLIMIYTAICIAVFKIFKIPVNKWTLPTAVLGGIFLIGFILLVMNYNHPFTATARIYFATTPILPGVKGRVVEVPVQANTPLKNGDVLSASTRSPMSSRSANAAPRLRRQSRTSRSCGKLLNPRRRPLIK